MPSFKIAALVALFAAVPAMAGTASIKNNCDFPVYITHSANGADQAQKQYGPGESYSAPIQGDAVCLKVMTEQGFCMTDNCMQLEYTSQPSFLWYDLSAINAEKIKQFINHGMTVNVSDPNAQQIGCAAGNGGHCANTYYQPYDDANSLSAAPDSDLIMNLCTKNMGGNGNGPAAAVSNAVSNALPSAPSANTHHDTQSSAAAPPAPATTAAPKAPVAPSYNGPVVEVTVTHTVTGQGAQPTGNHEKRHMHAHAHHHRH